MAVLSIGPDSADGAASSKTLLNSDGDEVAAATLMDIAHILNSHTVVSEEGTRSLLNDGCEAKVMSNLLLVTCADSSGNPYIICQPGIPVRDVFERLASELNGRVIRPGFWLYVGES